MFDIIPDSFFVPLASPNKLVYWECICKLFSVMDNQLSFGVERDVLVDELQYYFEQSNAADFSEEELTGTDSRSKANWMLRRLEHCGWLEIETDKSYVQKVNFKEYAVRIVKTLLEIAEGKQIEYQGYIYTIYSLVRSNTDHPGVVLLQILENTDLLITGLKNLNSNIKHYIDDLTRHKTVAEIMNALFNDYITNIVDKAYHRLLTSDNVSKFRPEIIDRLEAKGRSRAYVEKAAAEIASIKEISSGEAEESVYQYLHGIIDAFQNMDDILREINQKNTQYQRSAVNRARFMLTGSEDVRGQLKEILIGMNEEINREQMNLGGIYRIDFLEELIRIYSALLEEIYRAVPNIDFYHFGDIDVGGFLIYEDLCQRTGIPFKRYMMDLNDLKQYEAYGRALTENDRVRIERMLKENPGAAYADVLTYMLAAGIKLEQECFVRNAVSLAGTVIAKPSEFAIIDVGQQKIGKP